MNRWVLLVLLLFMAWLLIACEALPEGRYGVVPLDGQAVTPGATYEAQGRVFVIVTPAPSATSLPAATATPQPTPTQEATTLPTVTPGPPKLCQVKAARDINVRSFPGVTNTLISPPLAINEVIIIDWVRQDLGDGYVWAHHRRGWSAIRSGSAWWVYGTLQTEICVDVPGWPSGLLPPVPVVSTPPAALLFHAVPGANAGEMMIAYAVLKSKGIQFGVKSVNDPGLCRDAADNGGICIYRSVHPQDCPDLKNPDPKLEAYLYLLALSPYVNQNTHASYIELTNECNYQDGLAWYNTFFVEAIRLAQAWQWPPLVLPTFGPGAPETWWLDPLRPALVALSDSGGLFGFHAYSISREVGLCPFNEWLSYRHRVTRAKLNQMGLGDLEIVITEAARGTGNQPPSIADFVCWYQSIRSDPGLFGVALWTAGTTTAWPLADLNGHMIQIASNVPSR